MKRLRTLIIILFICTILLLVVLFHTLSSTHYFRGEENTEGTQSENDIRRRVHISIREIVEEKNEQTKPQQKSKPENPNKDLEIPREYYYSDELVRVGRSLFEGREGSFPTIIADYRKFLGFNRYRKAIEDLGGGFFIYNENSSKIERRLNFSANRLVLPGNLQSLSPRSRKIIQESLVEKYMEKMKMQKPGYEYSVIVLVPQRIDAYLIGVLDKAIQEQGRHVYEFSSFLGSYKKAGELTLHIQKGRLKSGRSMPLSITINFRKNNT